MSEHAKNNAKCEIWAEINNTDSIDKQSILSFFHNTCKNKIRDFMKKKKKNDLLRLKQYRFSSLQHNINIHMDVCFICN